MPRVTTIKTNFTAGELSPRLKARVDIAKYNNGAKTLLNFLPLVHGGARSRNGTRYRAAAKIAAKKARLVPFVVKRSSAFHVEFGDGYLRFFSGAGQILNLGVPYELTSPYLEADMPGLRYVQRQSTMFLAHQSYPMRKLVRYSDTEWKLSQVVFDVPPSEEIGERPSTTLTLGAVSGGAVVATAAANSFEASDVGRYIESGAGRGQITVYTSAVQVTLNIPAADAFASVGPIAANSWTITESPKTTCTPSVASPVGAAVNLTTGAAAWKNLAANVHVGSFVEINNGLVEITGYTSTTIVAGIIRIALTGITAAPSEGWALRQVQWNSVDGYPQAVGLYQQRLIAGGSVNYPNIVWGSRTGEYLNFAEGPNDADGFAFPLDSDELDEITHIAAARALHPLTAGAEWALFGGVEKAITPTNVQANPDTAYGSDTCRPQRVANDVVLVQEGGKKIRALGFRIENEQFNAPDISVLSEHITGDGITEMAYQKNPDQVMWMVRADGYLVSMSIDRDQDAIAFARHNTEAGAALVESVSTIPYAGATQLAALVKRTINGAVARYVEYFEEGLETDCAITGAVTENAVTGAVWGAGVVTVTRVGHGYATGDTIRLSGFTPNALNGEYTITVTGANTYTVPLAVDPGATTVLGTDAKAKTVWTGLGHLEAKTVAVVADGYVAKSQTVAAAQITLDKAAYEVEIGLHFDGLIETLPPEIPTGTGTAQGNAISIHEVVVRFYKSKGGRVNGQPILSRKFGTGAVLDQPVPEFTGDKRVENLGWDKTGGNEGGGSVTIQRDQPLAMQVLGVITRATVNDG